MHIKVGCHFERCEKLCEMVYRLLENSYKNASLDFTGQLSTYDKVALHRMTAVLMNST
jgi:hypothetical protein